MIRAFEKRDIPAVADLFNRIMLSEFPSRRNLPLSELHGYFERVFFHNPWVEDDIPSLVYQTDVGDITGFVGVIPRRMTFAGRPIRVANCFHYIVDPKSRSALAGIQLLKHFFAGSQDLSYSDGGGDGGRKVWCAVGGADVPLWGMTWSRVLRPGQFAADYIAEKVSKRPVISHMTGALAPLSHLADRAAHKMFPHHYPDDETEYSEQELDCDTMLNLFPKFCRTDALQPAYKKEDLSWLINEAEKMKLYGTLKKRLISNSKGEPLGWFMYYLVPGGVGTVLQIIAAKGHFNTVFDRLIYSAGQQGAVSLTGRILLKYIFEMTEKRCMYSGSGFTMIHTRDQQLAHAIQRGDAFLSSMEGEWCLVF